MWRLTNTRRPGFFGPVTLIQYVEALAQHCVPAIGSGASALRPFAGGLSASSASGDETHFCPVPLPRKIPSGGSLYRTRRNLRSPSLKVHVAAAWKRAICHGPHQPTVADDHRPIGEPGGDKLPRQLESCRKILIARPTTLLAGVCSIASASLSVRSQAAFHSVSSSSTMSSKMAWTSRIADPLAGQREDLAVVSSRRRFRHAVLPCGDRPEGPTSDDRRSPRRGRATRRFQRNGHRGTVSPPTQSGPREVSSTEAGEGRRH
jgi:hypothetical protein